MNTLLPIMLRINCSTIYLDAICAYKKKSININPMLNEENEPLEKCETAKIKIYVNARENIN